jgi:hypothetical protein
MRSVMSESNLPLRDILKEFMEMGVENLMTGRIKYKAPGGYITEQHRPCHKHGLCAVYKVAGVEYCTLYFNGEYYQFELSTDYLTQNQEKYYTKEGTWERDFGEIE